MLMASFISISPSPSPSTLFHKTPHLSYTLFNSLPSITRLKKSGRSGRLVLLRVNCLSEKSRDIEQQVEGGDDFQSNTTSPSPSSSPLAPASTDAGDSAYQWCAALGGLGFVETSYLTFLKLTNSDAICLVGGGCGDILKSAYSVVFGVPLPLFGMLAYGVVATLGFQLSQRKLPSQINEADARVILIGTITSMAVASTYFLYILSTKFGGESCLYCLTSALLSFSLFFITLKGLPSQELGLRLCIAGLVVAALSTSYNASQNVSASFGETDLPYFKTEITTHSSPFTLSLARHLHSIGAKLYGAFWCSHCLEQKEMFGHEAAEILDYVECFPNGFRKGTVMEKACLDVGIEGFPTWVINGQVLNGEQELSELARISGFRIEDFSPSN